MSVPAEHKSKAPRSVSFSLFIVSTSRFKNKGKLDLTGDIAEKLIKDAGHIILRREVIPDDMKEIRSALTRAAKDSDVVIFSGGTGLHPTDVTPDAVKPLLTREIPGFGELFRWLSYSQVGSAAMASRATAGVYERSLVFLLPGSPDGTELALRKLILPEAPHLVYLARGDHR